MQAKLTIIVVAVSIGLSGCATNQVATKKELFEGSVDKKQCYVFDTVGRNNARNMPTSVATGILGGLFPPLMLLTAITAGASAAADAESMPSKCGLTFEDAIKQSTETSFYEKAAATFREKSGKTWGTVKYVKDESEDCSVHQSALYRETENGVKSLKSDFTVCRNENGEPIVKNG